MLIDGKWTEDWQPVQAKDAKGGFVRQVSTFRDRPEVLTPGRYHLYVALICPWASRTLIARKLKGLEEVVSVSVLEPALTSQGWEFATPDPLTGARYMHQVYSKADPHVSGRATVPVLWDKVTGTIVNNESADILRIFNDLGEGPDLYPPALRAEIDALNEVIYPGLNNGVYRAGFATTQEAYDEAVTLVFQTLADLEARMEGRTWLMGETFTEVDIRTFVTAVRFDVAYHGIFKCNLRRFADHPRLQAWMERVLALPGVAETVNLSHIKRGYYSIKTLNPNGILPKGPDLAWARGLA
ncbi:glutathione S-transferase family protein [Stagnihabitans tardus]|uniref:Glutathione S-transferase family protein n=1 Tax=Stagnihabitans tardus TaxID=2699202 RepID=A0AAE5BWB5_9RHOB|nr:glutathione S-transferase C-terminal domain-containing protein [Stagnihabitans tardus]NBZ88594.1 glutathione S-transferase family protein [Stagnihabitans tardus]